MKKSIFLILLTLSMSNDLISQIDFARNLYCKLVFEEIEIRDTNNLLLDEKGVFDMFNRRDTAINCFGDFIEKFHNNLYNYSGFHIFLTEYEFDTLANKQDANRLDFFRIVNDDAGNYLFKTFAFSFNRKLIKGAKNIKNNSINDKRFITNTDEWWVIKHIKEDDRSIFIDDCHKEYRLNFIKNQIFNQEYQNSKTECIVTVDLDKIVAEKKLSYTGNKVYHDLSFNKGQWKTNKNKLFLLNENRDKIEVLNYEFYGNTLVLDYGNNYKIELEKIRKH